MVRGVGSGAGRRAAQRADTVAYLDQHLVAEVALGPRELYARYRKPAGGRA